MRIPPIGLSRRATLALQAAAAATPLLHAPLLALAAAAAPPAVGLSDGTSMPAIGFGTCCRASAKGKPLIKSTLEYLSQGGRLIDTAQMYENEAALGAALRASGVPRSGAYYFAWPSQTHALAFCSSCTHRMRSICA